MDPKRSDSSASSSDDLEQARRLTRALRGGSAPAASEAQPGYVRFAAPRPATPPPPPPPVPTAAAAPPVPPAPAAPRQLQKAPEGFGSAGWNKLLGECLAVSGAESAFVMDPQGLVVACQGARSAVELEAVGSRLMLALEQADAIEGGPSGLSVSLESEKGTLWGARLSQEGGPLLLGLFVPAGLAPDRQRALFAVLARAGASGPVTSR